MISRKKKSEIVQPLSEFALRQKSERTSSFGIDRFLRTSRNSSSAKGAIVERDSLVK